MFIIALQQVKHEKQLIHTKVSMQLLALFRLNLNLHGIRNWFEVDFLRYAIASKPTSMGGGTTSVSTVRQATYEYFKD